MYIVVDACLIYMYRYSTNIFAFCRTISVFTLETLDTNSTCMKLPLTGRKTKRIRQTAARSPVNIVYDTVAS